MADSKFISPSTLERSRWLALPAAMLALGGALVWWRRAQSSSLPLSQTTVSPIESLEAELAAEAPVPQPRKPQSPLRWLLYLGAAMLSAGVLIVISSASPELSAALFVLLMLASVLYVLFISADAISHGLQALRQNLSYPSNLRQRYWAYASFGFGMGAVALALWSAILFWDSRSFEGLRDQAVVMFVVCIITLCIALLLHPEQYLSVTSTLAYPLAAPTSKGLRPGLSLFLRRARTRLALFTGILLLLILTEINAQFLKSEIVNAATVQFQVLLLIIGTVLVVIGITGVRTQAQPTAQPAATRWERWRPLWPLALITLVALVLRIWHLETAMRFLVDERSFIDGTYELRLYPFTGVLRPFSSISAFPYMFPYFQTVGFGIFGNNLFGLRIPSAILGTLGIPALYFLARTLFDRKIAILAALFLATFPPHLQFSRIAICEIASPFFATLGFAFLARGMQAGDRRDFVISGVLFGFTHYFHEGGRLLYTPLAVLWIIGCLLFMPVSDMVVSASPLAGFLARFRRVRSNLGGWLVALALIAAPIYFTLIGINRPIFARLVDNSSGLTSADWRDVFYTQDGFAKFINDHVIPAFSVFFNQRDSTLFYSQSTALLLTGFLPVVILGFGVACFYWRKSGMMLLILWVVCTAGGNSLMKDSTGSPRFVMVFPALALLAAVGVRYVVPLVVRRVRWQVGVMAAVSIVLALYQANFYFNQHIPQYNFDFRFANGAPDGYDAAWRSLDFPPNSQVHLISTPVYNQIEAEGLIRVWRGDIMVDARLSNRFSPNYLKSLQCGVDHAFYVQKQDVAVVQLLHRFFKISPPQYTPYDDLAVEERFVLYYAAYNPDDGSVYSQLCARQSETAS